MLCRTVVYRGPGRLGSPSLGSFYKAQNGASLFYVLSLLALLAICVGSVLILPQSLPLAWSTLILGPGIDGIGV